MDFYSDFICNFTCIKKLHVFKTAFLGQKNVHLVLIILIRRGKFILYFLTFIYFSTHYFPRNIKKNARARRAAPSRARPPAYPAPLSSSRTGRRRAVSAMDTATAARAGEGEGARGGPAAWRGWARPGGRARFFNVPQKIIRRKINKSPKIIK